jgi:hypothetical protein
MTKSSLYTLQLRQFLLEMNLNEQQVKESLSNLFMYMELDLLHDEDLVRDKGNRVRRIEKVKLSDNVVVYDFDRYPPTQKKIKIEPRNKIEETEYKLRSYLGN